MLPFFRFLKYIYLFLASTQPAIWTKLPNRDVSLKVPGQKFVKGCGDQASGKLRLKLMQLSSQHSYHVRLAPTMRYMGNDGEDISTYGYDGHCPE